MTRDVTVFPLLVAPTLTRRLVQFKEESRITGADEGSRSVDAILITSVCVQSALVIV